MVCLRGTWYVNNKKERLFVSAQTSLIHNAYSNPTPEVTYTEVGKISPLTAIKEGFAAQFKSGKPAIWLAFAFVSWAVTTAVAIAGSYAPYFMGLFTIDGQPKEDASVGLWIAAAVVSVLASILSMYFTIGTTQAYIRGTHETNPKFSDLFVTNGKRILRSFGVAILIGVIYAVVMFVVMLLAGLVLKLDDAGAVVQTIFVVIVALAAFVIYVGFAFALYAVIDSDKGVFESIKISFSVAFANFFRLVGLLILTSLIVAVPSLILIGLGAWAGNATVVAILVLVSILWVVVVYGPTNVALVYAYREATHGPLTFDGAVVHEGETAIADEAYARARQEGVETREATDQAQDAAGEVVSEQVEKRGRFGRHDA